MVGLLTNQLRRFRVIGVAGAATELLGQSSSPMADGKAGRAKLNLTESKACQTLEASVERLKLRAFLVASSPFGRRLGGFSS